MENKQKTNKQQGKDNADVLATKVNKIMEDMKEESILGNEPYPFKDQDKMRNVTYNEKVDATEEHNQFHIEFKNERFYLIEQTPVYPNEYGISNTWDLVDETEISESEVEDYIKEDLKAFYEYIKPEEDFNIVVERYYDNNGHYDIKINNQSIYGNTVEITSDTMRDENNQPIYNSAKDWAEHQLEQLIIPERFSIEGMKEKIIEELVEEYSIILNEYLSQEVVKYEVQNTSKVVLSKKTSRSINNNSKVGWNYTLTNENDKELINVSWDEDEEGNQTYTLNCEGDIESYNGDCDDEMAELSEKVDDSENTYYESELYDHKNMYEDEFKTEAEKLGCEETWADEDGIGEEKNNAYGVEYTNWSTYYNSTWEVPEDKVEEFEKLCEKYKLDSVEVI